MLLLLYLTITIISNLPLRLIGIRIFVCMPATHTTFLIVPFFVRMQGRENIRKWLSGDLGLSTYLRVSTIITR